MRQQSSNITLAELNSIFGELLYNTNMEKKDLTADDKLNLLLDRFALFDEKLTTIGTRIDSIEGTLGDHSQSIARIDGNLVADSNFLAAVETSSSEHRKEINELKESTKFLSDEYEKMKLQIADIGAVHMPQECRTRKVVLEAIYKDIEEEIQDAAENGFKLLLVGDLNCKVGAVIKGNKEEVTTGGRILLKMTMKYKLAIVNSQSICEGLWTRVQGNEKSILDYVITFDDDIDIVEKMTIDEDKMITPYYIEDGERKFTDHFMIS